MKISKKESIIVVAGSMAEAFRPGFNCQALRNNCFRLSECDYLVGRS
ncbi:MAG: hypothetical protein ABSH25_10770 [Syntrophorhabdales bacterium]